MARKALQRKEKRAGRGARTGTSLVLLFAFSFAVMADPVSSVAYAIEAGLRALHGHLQYLLLTMGLVLAIISLVRLNYDQLIRRFPEGGGAVAATAVAFGEAWAFAPLGALIVDFVLTIAISVAAASSAVIAYFPGLADRRTLIALVLVCMVAGLTWFGHFGRSVFASMTVAFIAIGLVVCGAGFLVPHTAVFHPHAVTTGSASLLTVILAFPVAMALATGVEAPSSAIAQLGQLDDVGRERFGRITLWLTFAIEGSLTVLLAGIAIRLHVGIPGPHSTLIADVARASVGGRVAVRALPAHQLPAAARRSQLVVPGWTGAAEGARAPRARDRGAGGHPPARARSLEPTPHPVLEHRGVPGRVGRRGDRRRRTRSGAGALPRGGRFREFPVRIARDGASSRGAKATAGTSS